MSKTLFKVLVAAYMRNKQNSQILQDSLHAISSSVDQITNKISSELIEIKSVLFDEENTVNMSVIFEEETEREQLDQTKDGYEAHLKEILAGFNNKINRLKRSQHSIDQIMSIYKNQIKDLAKSLKKTQEKYQKLKIELTKLNKKDKKQFNHKQLLKNQRNQQEEILIRDPPEPVNQDFCINCIKLQKNIGSTQKKQLKDDQVSPQKRTNQWKVLSARIDTLKKKIENSQDVICNKDQEIKKLTQRIGEFEKKQKVQKEDQEKKKLKLNNTALRGQKVLMTNQLSSLKKLLAEKTEICQYQDVEIKKLKFQIQNLNGTLKWHLGTIANLKQNYGKTINIDTNQYLAKICELQRLNKMLKNCVDNNERLMEQFNRKLKQVEDGSGKEAEKYEEKVVKLQNMLDEKNETIIKLKSNCKSGEKNAYYTEMIKVLTKKVSERDEKIKILSSTRCQQATIEEQ